MTITWHLGATGTGTTGEEAPLLNHLTLHFTPQLALTGVDRADVQPGAIDGPDMAPQNDENANYLSTLGMSAEWPRGAASGSSALVAPVDELGVAPDMRTTQDMQMNIERASFFLLPRRLI